MYTGYTERDWFRTVGWGSVPDEYKMKKLTDFEIERQWSAEIDRYKMLEEERDLILRSEIYKYKRRRPMDVDKLRHELEIDEGRVDEIYLDHLGFPTFGIGHLVIESDAEDGLPVGTAISSQRVEAVFKEDVKIVCDDCMHLFPNFFELPEEAQLVIANMMFNMGRTKLTKFKKFIAAVNESNWMEASAQMKDSRWYNQVTKRAQRLRYRIERLWP